MPERPYHKAVVATARAAVRAQDLRRAMTMPERVLWNRLKHLRDSHGLVFRRQHPLGKYVGDFYCHAAALIVEVDGQHTHDAEHDRQRDAWMREHRIEVLRFGAWRLPREVSYVMQTIVRVTQERVGMLGAQGTATPPPARRLATSPARPRGRVGAPPPSLEDS